MIHNASTTILVGRVMMTGLFFLAASVFIPWAMGWED